MSDQLSFHMLPIKKKTQQNECHCHRPKNPFNELCDGCYYALPILLRLDLFHAPGAEQDRAVTRALRFLHGEASR